MSSFFSRSSTKSSSSSSSSLKDYAGPTTSDIFTTPSAESVVKKKWDYDEGQLKQIEELKAYSSTLLLPESDPYHPWEKRFLADPGTHPRYMRAAKWKMDDAQRRIKGTLEWRREFKPEIISPDEIAIEAEGGKIILTGFDYDGRPVIYMRPGRENTETSPRQIKHLIYHLERALDFMPPGQEQVAIIVDYKSATSQSNPSISTARKVLNILQNHYVERLGRGLVVNMPWWINAFFSGISPFMDPITRDKIRFNPKLTELVPSAQLDAEFGGDYHFKFDHKLYWKQITEFCRIAPDGSRVNDKGEKWYPPSGNGILAAVQGLVPVPGAVATGQVQKSGEAAPATGDQSPSSPTVPASAAGAAGAAGAAATVTPADAEKEQKTVVENGDAKGESGLEKGMKRLSVLSNSSTISNGLGTTPGKPAGEVAFDHPPTEAEKQEARASIEAAR